MKSPIGTDFTEDYNQFIRENPDVVREALREQDEELETLKYHRRNLIILIIFLVIRLAVEIGFARGFF